MAEDVARRRLGRGLAALIGETGAETAAPDRRPPRRLSIAVLRPNPRNPRKSFDDGDLAELTASIRERGVVQAILVRPVPGGDEGYEIIAGERRWRAAQKAGLHDVPVVVHEASDREALELAIIENVQRADLNPLEEAIGYQQLIDEHGYTQSQLADVIGKSRPHIANTLRLMKLPDSVQAYVRRGDLSAGHARALVTMADPESAAKRIVEGGLSVREAEQLADEGGGQKPRGRRAPETKSADTLALEKRLSDILGLEVGISYGPAGGEVRVRYKTLEQLDEICRRLRS
jgi:ParB family transcriptional regulator, chromosome partitioning protein